MKRLLHGLTGLLILLLPVLCGGVMIYANAFNTEFRDFLFQALESSPIIGVAFGLVMILIWLSYLGSFGPARPKSRYISFDSEEGGVSISINAVRDFIRKLGDEFGAVISLDPKICTDRDLLRVDLDVRIQTGTRIPELSLLLQNRVRESIREGLGIVEVSEIKVRVQEIVGAPPPTHTES
jgi:uncharacterized alkaline shock family protein YloU